MATDGNLGRDGRSLTVTSKDAELLHAVRDALGVRPRPRAYATGVGRTCWKLQWSHRATHGWLLDIGLTPAKSSTLGALDVPDPSFVDFLRRCIDGDGSVQIYTDRYHATKNAAYVYERLYVSLVSASPPFIEWIRATVARLTGLRGSIQIQRPRAKLPIWKLRYAKAESMAILRWIYYAPDIPCLSRKRQIAARFLLRDSPPARRRPGRPVIV